MSAPGQVATPQVGVGVVIVRDGSERWAWFAWSVMPEKLFQPLKTLVQSGYVPKNAA